MNLPDRGDTMNQRLAVSSAVVLFLLACVGVTAVGAAEDRPTERASSPPQCNPNAVVWRTPQPPANPEKGDTWVNPKDGMEMVYVAPGEFTLGTSGAQIHALGVEIQLVGMAGGNYNIRQVT